MIRRLIKPATALLLAGGIIFAITPDELLEAVTRVTGNLATLIDDGGSLVVDDKTFSNFDLIGSQQVGEGGTVLVPNANIEIVGTSSGPGGPVTLSFPLFLSASTSSGFTLAGVILSFDVTAADGNLISGVAVEAVGGEARGTVTPEVAEVFTNLSVGGNVVGTIEVNPPDNTPIVGTFDFVDPPQTLGVLADASIIADEPGEQGDIDIVTFTFNQETTPTNQVPEPGSLALMLGGAGMLLARRLYRRT